MMIAKKGKVMTVSFKNFEKWAKRRFGNENVLVQGKEIRIHSIFDPGDDDFHLWCSPSGGKQKRKNGTYHCFKSDKKGSLIKLVMLVDSCDRESAAARLGGYTSIRELEKQLEHMFVYDENNNFDEQKKPAGISLPSDCYLISELGTNNWWRKKAEEYLKARKIPIDGLYVCTGDRYKGRIIIPYYNSEGGLIYFNGRALGNSKWKYLGPPKEIGAGKEDVIYMAGKWPEANSLVYICEGEFNAMSLKQAELNACACGGKNMSEKQALMLSKYRVVLCLDRDKAGKAGTTKMSSVIMALETVKKSTDKILYVIPPQGCNDWNEFLVKNSLPLLHHYLVKNQKPLDYTGPIGTIGDYFNFSDIWQ